VGAGIERALDEAFRLPQAAFGVIDTFARAYPAARVWIWRRDGERMERLYPFDTSCDREPSKAAVVRSIAPGDSGPTLVVEVEGVEDGGAAAELLAEALAAVLRYEGEARSAARELSERYEEINLLYSISEVLGTVPSFDAAVHRILSDVADVLAAKRASLWVLDPAEQTLHLAAAVGEKGLSGPIPIDDPDSVTTPLPHGGEKHTP